MKRPSNARTGSTRWLLLLPSLLLGTLLPTSRLAAQAPVMQVKNSSDETLMQLNDAGGLLVLGDSQALIPMEGAGIRLMWYPRKIAFRVGRVDGDRWDDANVGTYSTAFGYEAMASGYSAHAMGNRSTASGDHSAARGLGSVASGWFSTAMGLETTAQAYGSLVMGRFNTISGTTNLWNEADPLLVAGNGADESNRSNALTLYKNGRLEIAGEIHAQSGGFRFPDGSLQATAASGGASDHGALNGLTDDDHAQYLLADGLRHTTNGFAVVGNLNFGTIPASGGGTRMMWYPGKAAFRAGTALGEQWDAANVGRFSTAFGNNTTASGDYATAMGHQTTASGSTATAMGYQTTASGAYATAMGRHTTVSGNYATAMGHQTTASGSTATAMGHQTTASGGSAMAMGWNTTAIGFASTAMGQNTTASGSTATAMGWNTTANGNYATAMGSYASTGGFQGSFVYGDYSTTDLLTATADNQFLLRAAGGVGIGTNTPQAALHVQGTAGEADLILGGTDNSGEGDNGILASDPAYSNSDLLLRTNDAVVIQLDHDASGEDADFFIEDKDGTNIFNVDEDGTVSVNGAVMHSSDRHRKERLATVDVQAVLAAVTGLRIQTWSYRGEAVRHLGPMAQDFHAAFGLGTDERYITTVDADGVALAAIQGLRELVAAQQAQLEAMRERLARLEKRLGAGGNVATSPPAAH